MENQIFRKASIDRVSSPEQLNDYVKVSNPSVWMILSAVIVLLIGVCVWGISGRLDTTVKTAALCENGTLCVYIKEADIPKIAKGMEITVNGESFTVSQISQISQISQAPVSVDGLDEYLLYKGGFQAGEWVYTAVATADIPDGVYSAEIIVESVSPMSFVLN